LTESNLPEVLPKDEHNLRLLSNVRPADWTNPTAAERYNLVVIGAGTAGLITAAVAAGLGARVALIERHLLGGDCLNVGCVPSKALIRSARRVAEARAAEKLGLSIKEGEEVDFAATMERVRRVRAQISPDDSVDRYQNELGVDVFLGAARFSGPGRIEVNGSTLRFKKAVIATGARAGELPIEGLAEAGYLTNETVFNLTERPRRFAIIGGGPIGCEMAQAFRRLGSEVVLFNDVEHILAREDADAAAIVQSVFVREGIQLVLGCRVDRVECKGDEKVVHFGCKDGSTDRVVVDEILVAVGRFPNVDGLDLETVGVEYDRRGIKVNDRLQTTNPRIFAAGDVCMNWKFTHAADAAAKIVVQNALFFGRKKLSALIMPWCTYTDPEIAHVGMYEKDAREQGIRIDTYTIPMAENNRAVADGEEEGFVRVHVRKGTGRIVGATIVAAHAGDLISQITLAMVGKLGLGTILNTIYPYPTQAEAIKRVAGAHARTRLTRPVKGILGRWMAWTR
jgi:pyruvate/2-oxoglutarate dehydrogenase complex dihydrolipoamide dehydrogenase (E3) component